METRDPAAKPTLRRDTLNRIGEGLRWHYDNIISDELPGPLAVLMMKLRAKEGGTEK